MDKDSTLMQHETDHAIFNRFICGKKHCGIRLFALFIKGKVYH